MSWQNLPTDYENIQWNGQRKYQIVENQDDTVSFVDVTDYLNDNKAQMTASELNRMTGGVNDLRNGINIAGAFDAATSYNIGDYVFYDGTLYRFTAAHTGAWNASHAVVVLITSELMSRLTDAPSDGNEYVRKNGAWVVPAGSGAATWGSISGTLADQTDLQTALNGKAASSHTHSYNSLTGKPTLGAMAAEADAPSDSKEYVRKNGDWVESSGGGSGAATWGSISGTLADQTDLKTALDAKANTADLGTMATKADVSNDNVYYLRRNGSWVTPDSTPTYDSNNAVKSDGVYRALLKKVDGDILAEAFDSTRTTDYPVGTLLSYYGYLYEVLVPFHGSWDLSCVQEISVADKLNEKANISDLAAKVSKTGDTMTGALEIKNDDIVTSNYANVTGIGLKLTNANGASVGEIQPRQFADGEIAVYAQVTRYVGLSQVTSWVKIIGETGSGRTSDFAFANHTHDDRYYTESEIDTALAAKQNTLTFDSTPTSGSTNPVTSGGVYDAIVAGFRDVYKVTLPSASSSKLTFSAPGITANHVLCVEGHAYYSNPSAVMSELSITTAANSITITGTLSGTTDIIVTLGIPRTITAS